MSAGTFVLTRYQTDSGNIAPIRVQPETVAATVTGSTTNAAPTAALTGGQPLARTGGGARRYGIRARYITVRPTTAAPTGYQAGGLLKIPILVRATFDAVVVGGTCTYLGAAYTVVGKTGERGR